MNSFIKRLMKKQIPTFIILYINILSKSQNTINLFQNVHMDNAMTPSLPSVNNCGHLVNPLPPSSCPRGYWMSPIFDEALNLSNYFPTLDFNFDLKKSSLDRLLEYFFFWKDQNCVLTDWFEGCGWKILSLFSFLKPVVSLIV